mgnify:CR=1 FL=1
MFEKFETMNRAEREQVAENLTAYYAQIRDEENAAFADLVSAKSERDRDVARIRHAVASASLGTIQRVFDELGIDPDSLEIPF